MQSFNFIQVMNTEEGMGSKCELCSTGIKTYTEWQTADRLPPPHRPFSCFFNFILYAFCLPPNENRTFAFIWEQIAGILWKQFYLKTKQTKKHEKVYMTSHKCFRVNVGHL